MEILLLIAIIVVGASGLYVALTFNTRTRQNFAPLMDDAATNIGQQIDAVRQQTQTIADELQEERKQVTGLEARSGELRQQMQLVTGELRQERQQVSRLEADSGELRQQMEAIAAELRRNGELVRRLETASGELRQHIQAITGELRQRSQPGSDLAQLGHRVAELGESLAEQSTRISGIYRYVMRRETQAWNSAENDSLLLAMLEAESHVDGKGWGGRPHLYALTEKTSAVAAGHEFAAGMKGARPGARVPVEQPRLPEGDLTGVLASIHWPADVVGCVLVTELATLAPREDAPIDAVAEGQWTSTHPDGRPARLAVGVCRSGEHTCVLRIKGEDEIQVRPELAGDLVTALMGTF
jgi:archaellum component FlaC